MSLFGTDGIRGKFGSWPITPEFALHLGFAAGRVLARHTPGTHPAVVMGKDTRLSGYVLESALQSGLNAAGVDVRLLGPLPTPAIAHMTRAFHANAGIVISASHNPYCDNGIKFFSAEGKKLPDALQDEIAAALDEPLTITDPDHIGKSYRIDDAAGRYIEFCKSTFPYHLDLKGLKIAIDCAHGAGYVVGPAVLRELGATVIPVAVQPDGYNINDGCGSTHLDLLRQTVLKEQADVGLALDGDGDRIMLVDHAGNIIDGDAILYILASAAAVPPAGVVGTLMSNMGLEQALNRLKIDFKRASVGDRYVMAALEAEGWQLGGEPSGHILCLDKSTTGDALISGLQVLAIMVQRGVPLTSLLDDLQVYPQQLVNVRLAQKPDLDQHAGVQDFLARMREELGSRGRILVRASGTEPLIRVMVEAQEEAEATQTAHRIADFIKNEYA